MKAWQFVEVGKPIQLRETEVPAPSAGEVLVDVKASGLCHSDVGYLDGTIRSLPYAPITLGHEFGGVVSRLGAGATEFTVGQRVVARSTLETPGNASDGGYAEYVVARTGDLVAVPDGLGTAEATVASDAGMTAYHAINRGGVTHGTRVGIIGLGGLGFLAAQFAVTLGAEVYAAEINEDIWPEAERIGVTGSAKSIKEFADKGLEVIVDFAGFGVTTADAIEAIGHGGTIVQVGIGKEFATIRSLLIVWKELRILGSAGGTRADVRNVLELIAQGRVKPRVSTIPFDDIGKGMKRLEEGKVQGRLVAVQP